MKKSTKIILIVSVASAAAYLIWQKLQPPPLATTTASTAAKPLPSAPDNQTGDWGLHQLIAALEVSNPAATQVFNAL